MEFQEFMVYLIVTLLGVIVLLGIINMLLNGRIIKRFSGKLIRILSTYELQSEDLSALFTTTYFNNNMSDVKVKSFGYIYCNEQVDYFEEYTKKNKLDDKGRVVIEPGEYLKFNLTYDRMNRMLQAIRYNRKNIPRIYAYILDTNGVMSKRRASIIHKNVKRIYKAELKKEKLIQKENYRKVIREAKERKKDARAARREKKKEEQLARKKVRLERRKERRNKRGLQWKKFKTWIKNLWTVLKDSISNIIKRIIGLFSKKKERE